MKLNKRIFRMALASQGLTQQALSRRLQVDRGTISRWVNGWASISNKHSRRLCRLLEVSPRQLFCNQGERK